MIHYTYGHDFNEKIKDCLGKYRYDKAYSFSTRYSNITNPQVNETSNYYEI